MATNVLDQGVRKFELVWSELERRHAWKITEVSNDNPRPAMSKIPFCWQDYHNPHLVKFREENHLEAVIANAKSDWDALLKLRHWVFNNLINGTNPAVSGLDPATLLAASRSGGTFFCTHFAVVFVAAATSLGFVARKLSVDGEHTPEEPSNMHGVVDVWVDSLRKWVCLDPNYDHHYEYNGIPLSAEEVGQRWQTDQGKGVKVYIGPNRQEMERARTGIKYKGEACALYWHSIDVRNDLFRRDGYGGKNPVVLLVDESRKKQEWYQGKPPNTFRNKRYESGTFIITENKDEAYPDINSAYFELEEPHKMPYYCRVKFYTPCSPNFSHYEIRVDGGEPQNIYGGEFPWRFHLGDCRLEARTVNEAGRKGHVYSMTVRIQKDDSRSGEWPWNPQG